jgi:hypothetical protein
MDLGEIPHTVTTDRVDQVRVMDVLDVDNEFLTTVLCNKL